MNIPKTVSIDRLADLIVHNLGIRPLSQIIFGVSDACTEAEGEIDVAEDDSEPTKQLKSDHEVLQAFRNAMQAAAKDAFGKYSPAKAW